jgi:hypothetical protein
MKKRRSTLSLSISIEFIFLCYEIITQCWLLIIFWILEAWTITLCKWSTQKDTKYFVEMRIASFPVDKQWKKKKSLALYFWLINKKKKLILVVILLYLLLLFTRNILYFFIFHFGFQIFFSFQFSFFKVKLKSNCF